MNINALFDIALKGDEIAEKELFEALSVRYRAIAHQRIWEINDVEDIVQEALMTVVREYRGLDVRTSFSAWAIRVLDNRILAYLKRKRTSQSRQAGSPPVEYTTSDGSHSPDLKLRLMRCLKEVFRVNPQYARILNLHYQGFTIDEVCRHMGIKSGNAYVTLSRARQMLAGCLEKRSEAK